MSEFKPNHICKNPSCRKHYYACNYCTRTLNWRSVACSLECYQKYMDLVIEERSKGKSIDTVPERTDMTDTEVKALMNKPVEIVLNETKEALKEYITEDDSTDFSKVVDRINTEIVKEKSNVTRQRKKKNEDK